MPSARFVSSTPIAPVDPVQCTPIQLRTAHMLLSALLDYPDDRFQAALESLDAMRQRLPLELGVHLDSFAAWAGARSLREVAEHYVETFDQQRRCALYLSYYVAGDTRLRGSAILGFREFARAIGYEPRKDELDDYLPIILELSAVSGDPLVWELLASHQEGIEIMRSALQRAESPYLHLLNALACTLPEVSPEVYERFQRLVTQGPPTEMVGTGLPLWSTP